MSENPDSRPASRTRKSDLVMLVITIVSVILLGLFSHWDLPLAFLITSTVIISIVIWQACDPFAEAAQWVGRTFRLPGAVRGATLDAIASSLPELFSGIFFVVVAVMAVDGGAAAMAEACGEGFGSTIATCAGSAIYNMILIPAACALVISFWRKRKPVVEVESAVLWRDGVYFLVCEGLLLYCLYQNAMQWWMAGSFLALYVLYVLLLHQNARAYRFAFDPAKRAFEQMGIETPPKEVAVALAEQGVKTSAGTVARIRDGLLIGKGNGDGEEDDEEGNNHAPILFGSFHVPLNRFSVCLVLAISTAVAAGACYFLVQTVHATAEHLGVPAFFVAVILAAAASSLPDMFLSIGAALRGDDSGAVSNAFGSNIFDICICLSIPLLLCCYLNHWQPISLLQDGKPMAGLVGLRALLWVLTLVTLGVIWHKRQVTRTKALILIALYGVFIAYAVLGSLDISLWRDVSF